MSTGRGGAGNIGKERRESFTSPKDLETPIIKADTYTTGRGGSGNMAKNDPQRPELARAAQDVEAPKPRDHEGPFHYGRGGAGNADHDLTRTKSKNQGEGEESVAQKGKGLLGKITGKK